MRSNLHDLTLVQFSWLAFEPNLIIEVLLSLYLIRFSSYGFSYWRQILNRPPTFYAHAHLFVQTTGNEFLSRSACYWWISEKPNIFIEECCRHALLQVSISWKGFCLSLQIVNFFPLLKIFVSSFDEIDCKHIFNLLPSCFLFNVCFDDRLHFSLLLTCTFLTLFRAVFSFKMIYHVCEALRFENYSINFVILLFLNQVEPHTFVNWAHNNVLAIIQFHEAFLCVLIFLGLLCQLEKLTKIPIIFLLYLPVF